MKTKSRFSKIAIALVCVIALTGAVFAMGTFSAGAAESEPVVSYALGDSADDWYFYRKGGGGTEKIIGELEYKTESEIEPPNGYYSEQTANSFTLGNTSATDKLDNSGKIRFQTIVVSVTLPASSGYELDFGIDLQVDRYTSNTNAAAAVTTILYYFGEGSGVPAFTVYPLQLAKDDYVKNDSHEVAKVGYVGKDEQHITQTATAKKSVTLYNHTDEQKTFELTFGMAVSAQFGSSYDNTVFGKVDFSHTATKLTETAHSVSTSNELLSALGNSTGDINIITLTGDITDETIINHSSIKNPFVINLNGHSMKTGITTKTYSVIYGGTASSSLQVWENGTLTLDDVTAGLTTDHTVAANGGTLILSNCKISTKNNYPIQSINGGRVTANNVQLESLAYGEKKAEPYCRVTDGSTMLIDGVKYTADPAGTVYRTHTHDGVALFTELTQEMLNSIGYTIPAGNYYLSDDLTAPNFLEVNANTVVNLCLNGKALNLGSASVEVKTGGTLNIYDCDSAEAGKITTASSGTWTGTIKVYGTYNQYGGTVENTGTSTTTSALITPMSSNGIINISGGKAIGNRGIVLYEGGTLNVSGTAYIESTPSNTSNGSYFGIYMYYGGTATITGGTVKGYYGISTAANSSKMSNLTVTGTAKIIGKGSSGYGIMNEGELYISGGEITGNHYGVYTRGDSYSKLYLSGAPSISGTRASITKQSADSLIYASYGAAAYTGNTLSIDLVGSITSGNVIVSDILDNQDRFNIANENYALILGTGDNANDLILHQHAAEADDGDCTTPIKCSCGAVVTEGNADHSYTNACDTECNNAGCTAGNRTTTHTPNDDDGNCTTEIKCSVCGAATTEGNASHIGGTATCTDKAVCTECGTAYGELNAENHTKTTFIYTANADGETHTKKYECCETVAATNEAHDYGANDMCICGAEKPTALLPAPTYTVTVENGTVDGEGGTTVTVDEDGTVTVRANEAPSGKRFKGWSVNGNIVSTDEVYTFSASDNITITAVYEDIAPTGDTLTPENDEGSMTVIIAVGVAGLLLIVTVVAIVIKAKS